MTRTQREFAEHLSRTLRESLNLPAAMLGADGVPVLYEAAELRQMEIGEPCLFVGRWLPEGKRLTAPTVWYFVQKANELSLRLPAGAVNWLSRATPGHEMTVVTPTEKVVITVTRP